MKNARMEFDRDYLRRCKASTIEQRLDWLAAAQGFVEATDARRKKKSKKSS